jgi:chromosome segregation protein
MHLEKIKLAGFKSFADPTAIVFPKRLVGIVGPNGCGKSNLVDAVRFVIGESSAKHLRGGAMPDVIFNGSATRKPAAFASVELIFDNREGRLGGEYAKFSSLALKREISRDGESRYFLNGTRCRRRDVVDVLLGTGLGPRSYAVIEQGMIAHLIEAKPEELRGFVEEAAGLSKYKERRHETELKLEHVRANLQRAADLRAELKAQVEHLANQAKQAERYRALGQAIQHCQQELIAIKWRQAESAYRCQQARLNELEKALAQAQAGLAQAEQTVAHSRAEVERLSLQLQEQQASLYELNALINQCDQALRHAQKTLEERSRALEAWRSELSKSQAARVEIQAQLKGLAQERARLEQEHLLSLTKLEETQKRCREAELGFERLKLSVERDLEAHRQLKAQAEMLKAEVRHLEHQLAQTLKRRDQLIEERASLLQALETLDLAALELKLLQAQKTQELKLAALESFSRSLKELAGQKQETERSLRELEVKTGALKGKLEALETVQREALGKDRAPIAPRLAEVLEVESGWEKAAEIALSEWLEAVLVESLSLALEELSGAGSLLEEGLVLIEPRPVKVQTAGEVLTSKIKTPWDFTAWLSGYRCILTLEEALARRGELSACERWITPQGDQVGPNWIKLKRANPQPGILERQKTMQALRFELEVLEQERLKVKEQFDRLTARMHEGEKQLKTLQAEEREAHALGVSLAAELKAAKLRQAETQEKLKRLAAEILQVENSAKALEAKLAEHAEELARQVELTAAQAGSLEERKRECDKSRAHFQQLAAEVQKSRDLEIKLRAALERVDEAVKLLEQQFRRVEAQEQDLSERLKRTEAEQLEGKAPIERLQRELESLLARRAGLERELASTRSALKQAEAKLREHMGLWRRQEEVRDRAKSALEQARLEAEATRVLWQAASAEAQAIGDLAEVLNSLPETANLQDWQARLERLKAEQARLGEVNLVAIEEHRRQEERLRFLDKQCHDLEIALERLEKAIRQIDRESRSCFRATFEAVNRHFKERFPLLFGGGEAWLELTGADDLLEAGIRIMARPPGKRNSSIYLLSGGEKALTAVALVFAFFELNPAPVCFLDEVDAPLDEANVERFCQLLRSMAERVQFVFITHNKTTMEIADHLIGVTMREPGVSRIVAVDLKQAAEMAAA